ncbi:conserved hypothetical protein [Alteracholeplasma palmae J233]|uniref:Transcriptional regulator, AbiEi antitoxin, Type IV TA system n=1 Tax=Alteracholeplasma palmae (strain ATCC 49389 / J233) TaxID=1318466 RepID=U4KJP7_ALTPJ|nr:hypothetical protein [Alteracholeplasma palmae]CCV63633.1 conserved hypothetical protein [Alteracholeplasma palmae J233]
MILTTKTLFNKYKKYNNIQGKIDRMVQKGKYIPINKGLYETNSKIPGYYLSVYIYKPSYLSFEYALSHHGLIPERVYTYTAATFKKNRTKTFINQFGEYTYRDIPEQAFPLEVKMYLENNYIYYIATPEKALCDKLYTLAPVYSLKAFKSLLFEDLRIDYHVFSKLNKDKIIFLSTLYKKRNLKYLSQLIKEMF